MGHKTRRKYTRQTTYVLSAVMLIAMFVLSSCDHKELVFDMSTEVSVNFDWSSTPMAAPQTMRLAVFSGEAQPVFFPANVQGSTALDLPAGNFQLIGYNSDTEVLHSRGSNWEEFEIFSQESEMQAFSRIFGTRAEELPRARGAEDESFIEQPDPLWASAVGNIKIPGRHIVTMPMKSAIIRYTFSIINIENLDNVRKIAGTISGMSESYIPYHQRCSETYCTIPFFLQRITETSMSGTVRTFGYRTSDNDKKQKLAIYVETIDGERMYYTFDVTNALNKASESISDTGDVEVNIEITTLPVPEPITNGNGLHPTVDTWQEIDVGIIM